MAGSFRTRVLRVWIPVGDEESLMVARGFLDGLDEVYGSIDSLSEEELGRIVGESDVVRKKRLLLRVFRRLPRGVRRELLGGVMGHRLLGVLRRDGDFFVLLVSPLFFSDVALLNLYALRSWNSAEYLFVKRRLVGLFPGCRVESDWLVV